MSEILNLSSLCRCCHMDGSLRSLNCSYSYMGKVEVYANMLHDTFGLLLNKPFIEASYSICEICIEKLRNALEFKKQVEDCEMMFEKYCKNEIALQSEIKIENELYGDEMIIKPDISINSKDNESTSAEFDGEVSNSGQNYKNEERIIKHEQQQNINVEIQLKDCLQKDKIVKAKIQPRKSSEKPKSNITNNKIRRDDSLKKNKTVKFKIQPMKSLHKPKSEMSTSKIQQKLLQKGKSDKPGNTKSKQEKHSIFSCIFCNKDFSTRGALRLHKLEHNDKRYDCHICGKRFINRSILVYHINTHTRQKVFICDICNKEFLDKSNLKNHIVYTHLAKTKPYMCEFCGHHFVDRSYLNIHISTVHMKLRPFKCDQCLKTFTTKKMLKIHLRTHTGERPYKCHLCDKAFVSPTFLSCHKKRDHKNLLYQACHECEICGKKFINKASVTVHTRTHIGEKLYKCQVCEKDFMTHFLLNRHVDFNHTGSLIGVKPYQCHICRKDFRTNFTRRRHIETMHDVNAKRTSCEVCHTSFKQKAQLTRHMKNVHNPEKQFMQKTKCGMCQCSVRDMEKHMKCHMDSSRHMKCSHCPKSYPTKSALNRHIKHIHSGITYNCDLCAKKYVRVSNVERHKLRKHKIQIQLKVEQTSVKEIKSENNL